MAYLLLFAIGMGQTYLFELGDGSGVVERCPPTSGTEEQSYPGCMRELLTNGPLVFGREALLASFVLGTIALGSLFRIDRRGATITAALLTRE